MLKITVPGTPAFDEDKNEFVTVGDLELELEHSLVSLSKWESHFKKPFLDTHEKTDDETLWYVKEMIQTPNVPDDILDRLSEGNMRTINDYISDKMTATWFTELPDSKPKSREIITSEIIYYWMISLNIPFECEHWHLNRLLTLVRVCNEKNQPAKKMSKAELVRKQKELNAQRRQKYGTNG